MLQHVELIHPENGESPFLVKEEQGPAIVQSSSRHPRDLSEAVATDAADTNVRYVTCPYNCGEHITQAELFLHTDFHVAERMAFEEADVPNPPGIELSEGPCNDEVALKDIAESFSTDLPRSLRNRSQLQSSDARHTVGGKRAWSFRDFLLGSPNLPQRQSVQRTLANKASKARRLGVSMFAEM